MRYPKRYGYHYNERDRVYVPDHREHWIVRKIVELFDDGCSVHTIHGILESLLSESYIPTEMTMYRVLRRAGRDPIVQYREEHLKKKSRS